MQETWLSILDYVRYKNISISTIRRYIKADRVKYKLENGKYFIYVPNFNPELLSHNTEKELMDLKFEVTQLERENRQLKEQVSELRMLVSAYENRQAPADINTTRESDTPPAVNTIN